MARRRGRGGLTDRRSRTSLRPKPGPGGVDDGLPTDSTGAPLLARWFAIAMVVLAPIAIVVTVVAFLSAGGSRIDPAARRPPGTETVTHDRGDATLNQIRTAEAGPDCASDIQMVGDDAARRSLRRALSATCQLLQRSEFEIAAEGMRRWAREDGVARIAVFELTGVDSSARMEDGRLVVELNAKFQIEPGSHGAPALVHELTHLAAGMPGSVVTASAELAAVRAQAEACERLVYPEEPPRGCRDAAQLLAQADPLASLRRAGYPDDGGTDA